EQRLHERLTTALETALQRTLETHGRRLALLDQEVLASSTQLTERLAALASAVRETAREHREALVGVTHEIGALLEGLTRLRDDGHQLQRLEEPSNHNRAALAGAATFEQALHSLTAAVHMLTARAAAAPGNANRLGARPGTAA